MSSYKPAVLAFLAKVQENPAAALLPSPLSSDPLATSITLMLAVSVWCFVSSMATGNYSQMDRLWSIVPFVYVWVFTLSTPSTDWDPRLTLMAIISTLWGLRLTYNFGRKGGYTPDHEDYRWPELRKVIRNPLLWQLFNLSFIAFYQNVLLWLTAAPPAFVAWQQGQSTALNMWDALAASLFLTFLFLEGLTDQQQWNFQQSKYNVYGFPRRAEWAKDYQRGFRTTGVFRYSRHLNFFCEQGIWWSFYLFSYAATNAAECPINACLLGPMLLSLLFQGSTWYTESITLGKYPDYAYYQQITPMLMPGFPSGEMPDPKKSK